MTLLFMDGFDNGLTMMKPEWDANSFGALQTGRDGSTNGAVSMQSGASGIKFVTLPSAAATCVVGVAIRPAISQFFSNGTANALLGFRTGTQTTDSVSFTVDAAGHLVLHSGIFSGTVLATGSFAFTLNTWTQIQVKVTSSASALSVQVYVNGSTTADISYNGASASSQTAAITKVSIGNHISATANAVQFDDLWICDTVDATATQGRPFNDVLGDLRVATLVPTGVGDTTQWTPNTAVANWTTVDENPPNTTDFVSAATAGLRDTYAMTDLVNATAVYALRVGAYAQKSDAGASSILPGIKEPGGTVDAPSTIALSQTYSPAWASMVTRKADSSLWTVADVNAALVSVDSA